MKFFVMYGQTEATARMSCLPWEKAEEKFGSIGFSIPGGNFSLQDEKGQIIKNDSVSGELLYRGNNVSLGYAESREDLCLGDLNQGRLATGDLAYRDADGFYFITGRKHRFLKVFGYRVNLQDVEELVREAGFESACAGRDDRIDIYVTDKNATNILPTKLSQRTGLHPSAFRFIFINRIPRNDAGKILYTELENMDKTS